MLLDLRYSHILRDKVSAENPRFPVTWFWIVVAALLVAPFVLAQTASLYTVSGACLIAFAALLPTYLWLRGKTIGLPIFPIYALTHLWTYAIPLVIDFPEVARYTPEMHLQASLTTSGFLFLGTFVWYQFVKLPPSRTMAVRVFDGKKGERYILVGYAAGVMFSIAFAAQWTDMDAGLFALIRGSIYAVTYLSSFALAYRWGTLELSGKKTTIFLLLVAIYVLANSATLLLVNALSGLMLVSIAFCLGRRKIPLLPLIVLAIFVIPLHYGKADMRNKYWHKNESSSFQPWDYPAIYAEWAGYSYQHLFDSEDEGGDSSPQAFMQRAGLINLLLLVQEQTSNEVPFLNGATYSMIPRLLIPRFLDPEKPASHEGTSLLNIHFGKQTREDTLSTTIGWGLLNEAYANFGFWGAGALAIVLGTLYGAATRWSMGCPVLSARYLFAILLISMAFQTEFSAGVYISALFQSTVPLLALSFFLMKRSQGSAALATADVA
jgi:hypothetical protein